MKKGRREREREVEVEWRGGREVSKCAIPSPTLHMNVGNECNILWCSDRSLHSDFVPWLESSYTGGLSPSQ